MRGDKCSSPIALGSTARGEAGGGVCGGAKTEEGAADVDADAHADNGAETGAGDAVAASAGDVGSLGVPCAWARSTAVEA